VFAVVVVALSGMAHSEPPQAAPSLLRPGSPDLTAAHFSMRCDSEWFLAREQGDTVEKALLAQQVTERMTVYRGKPALLLVAQTRGIPAFVDSALVYRDGLAPIWETTRSGAQMTRYTYEGSRVGIAIATGDSVLTRREHRYHVPVFNFQELDALIRSLPLRRGYSALLPLYSEGDDSVEVDTVSVAGREAHGVWRIRFADPAVVATIDVDEASRGQVAYSHVFRKDGPAWRAGTVWRRAHAACGD
jgi:hypothetical protein